MTIFVCVLFFFFKHKTAYEVRISDWSSDVCSSDLGNACLLTQARLLGHMPQLTMDRNKHLRPYPAIHRQQFRSPGMARDMDMCLPVGSHVHMLGSQSILDFANGDLIAGDLF